RYLNGAYYNSISTDSKNMIAQETWYLGGPTTSNYKNLTTSEYYAIERSNNVYPGNPTYVTQNIGLLYASDLLYAGGSKFMNEIPPAYCYELGSYLCHNRWLQISLSDSNTKVLAVEFYALLDVVTAKGTDDELLDYYKQDGLPGVYPTLYLKENVEII